MTPILLFTITQAGLGQSWLFDSTLNINATLTAVDFTPILGTMDSVKTITLSNGKTFKIAKNFGLCQSNNFYNNDNYLLCGLEQAALGIRPPSFWEIYDFEVGDELIYDSHFVATGFLESSCSQYKRKITQKQVFADSIVYTFDFLSKTTNTQMSTICGAGPNTYHYQQGISSMTIYLHPNSTENKFREAFIKHHYQDINFINYHDDMSFNSTCFLWYGKDSINNITKIGKFGVDYQYDLDSLLLGIYTDVINIKWEKGLGITKYSHANMEAGVEFELVGYVKNGIQVGIMYPDWFLTDISPSSTHFCQISPNPAQEEVIINSKEVLTIQIRDVLGKVVHPLTFLADNTPYAISLSEWNSGIYYIEIQNDKGDISFQKLVKE